MQQTWRGAFIASGVLIGWGGSMHPGGTMEQMLADPAWLPGHLMIFGGFVALGLGMWGLRRRSPQAMSRTVTLALAATALQALEMFLHSIAYVDLEQLRAGASTPVLTAHLTLTPIAYPIFAIAISLYIVSAARHKVVGSHWIAWLGVAGVVMQGVAGFLVPLFGVGWARSLFAGVVLFALWEILAAVWPTAPAARAVATT